MKKSDEEIIHDILYRKYKQGFEAGKKHYWARGTLNGSPILVDYENQIFWTKSIPLREMPEDGVVIQSDDG